MIIRCIRLTLALIIISTVLFGGFSVFHFVETCNAAGTTIYVDDDNTAGPWDGTQDHPYQYIQEGVNNASIGDTVYVYSGIYNENVFIETSLNLISSYSISKPVVNGQDEYKSTIEIMSDSVTVSGFEIHNTISASYHGISIGNTQYQQGYFNYISITDCYITDVEHGILLRGSYNNIGYCEIKDSNKDGIFIFGGGSGVHNVIYHNTIDGSLKGIDLQSSDNNEIYNNTITDCRLYGIMIQSSNNGLYYNRFIDNNQNARDLGSNTWYNVTLQEGNYWDDYSGYDNFYGPNQDIPGSDGIGDIPYSKYGIYDPRPLGYFLTGNQKPQATIKSINPSTASYGEPVSFSGMGVDLDGIIIGFNWRSSIDEHLSTSPSFSTASLSPGTHTIYFKVLDNDDEWSTEKTRSIVVTAPYNQKPVATISSINPKQTTYGGNIFFSGYGIDAEGPITGYKWISDLEGIISTEQSFNRTDLLIGTHVISFQVKDNSDEWSNIDSTTIIISPSTSTPDEDLPVADAGGPYSGTINKSVSFDGSRSYDTNGSIVSYTWDLGDGTIVTGETPGHAYNASGNYTVTLTVTDNEGYPAIYQTYVNIIESTDSNDDNQGFIDDLLENFDIPLIVLAPIIAFIVLFAIIGLFFFWIKH